MCRDIYELFKYFREIVCDAMHLYIYIHFRNINSLVNTYVKILHLYLISILRSYYYVFYLFFFPLVIIYFLSCSHMPKLRIYFFLLFLQSFHVIYRYLSKNELASRNVGRRIADIYIYEEYDIRGKMKVVSRKGRRRMNLS